MDETTAQLRLLFIIAIPSRVPLDSIWNALRLTSGLITVFVAFQTKQSEMVLKAGTKANVSLAKGFNKQAIKFSVRPRSQCKVMH